MKKAKIKNKVQKQKVEINETYSFKTMIITIIILIIVFLLFYLITTLVVKPNSDNKEYNDSMTEIDDTKITLNHLLDRNKEEYYVLATMKSMYPSDVNYNEIYDKYITDYSSKENALDFYKIDLDDALNKNYVGNDLNITESLENMKLNNEILFKIKNGKIDSYYVGNSKIINVLSSL